MDNKKGSLYFSVIIAIILFMVGMIVVNFVKTEVSSSRTSLNCAAPATDGTKILCLLVDSTVPYWIILVLSISLAVITEKILI